jgi:hypothetical protein
MTPYTRPSMHSIAMRLVVGHRSVLLPSRHVSPDDVRRAVEKINRPFIVAAANSPEKRFSVRRRVFFSTDDVRVECENEGELGLACKLISEDHNRWQDSDNRNLECIEETERMEQATLTRLASDDTASSGDEAQSDEDISIQEWGQMGYKWFRREDVAYV